MAYPKRKREWVVYDVVWRDTIIYVGCTGNYTQRLARHRSAARFPDGHDFIVALRFPASEPAFAAETKRIQAFRPVLNIENVRARGRGDPLRYLADTGRAGMQIGSKETARRIFKNRS